MRTSTSIAGLASALAKAQGEFSNPVRNRQVSIRSDRGSYDFSYATLDVILDMVRPILAGHELAYVQTVHRSEDSRVVVTTRLLHGSGEWLEEDIAATPDFPGIQAVGSLITYLKRYALTAILGISADEDDDGNRSDGNKIESSHSVAPRVIQAKHTKTPTHSMAVPVPLAHGDGKPDWIHWAKVLLPKRLERSKTPGEIRTILTANADALATFKTLDPQAYIEVQSHWTGLIEQFDRVAA